MSGDEIVLGEPSSDTLDSERETSFKQCKGNRAREIDGILAELMEHARENVKQKLYQICKKMRRPGNLPILEFKKLFSR